MDSIRKLADALNAGAFVAAFDDDTLVAFARQLVGWRGQTETFERVRAMAQFQAKMQGQDLDAHLTGEEQHALFDRLRQGKKCVPLV